MRTYLETCSTLWQVRSTFGLHSWPHQMCSGCKLSWFLFPFQIADSVAYFIVVFKNMTVYRFVLPSCRRRPSYVRRVSLKSPLSETVKGIKDKFGGMLPSHHIYTIFVYFVFSNFRFFCDFFSFSVNIAVSIFDNLVSQKWLVVEWRGP